MQAVVTWEQLAREVVVCLFCMHAIYVFPSKLFNGIDMATVSYSQYHVRLVSLEGFKMLGSNFTFCSTTTTRYSSARFILGCTINQLT
jgi:hypothetical protein